MVKTNRFGGFGITSLSSFYAILNPFDKTDPNTVLSNHLLSVSTVLIGGGYRAVRANIGVSSASTNPLVYWEIKINSGSIPNIGIANSSFVIAPSTSSVEPGFDTNSWGYLTNSGSPFKLFNNSGTAYGIAFGAGDVVQVALDMTNGFVYFGVNNTFTGTPTSGGGGTGAAFSGLTGTLYPLFGTYGGNAYSYTAIFDPATFNYTPPAGYTSLHH